MCEGVIKWLLVKKLFVGGCKCNLHNQNRSHFSCFLYAMSVHSASTGFDSMTSGTYSTKTGKEQNTANYKCEFIPKKKKKKMHIERKGLHFHGSTFAKVLSELCCVPHHVSYWKHPIPNSHMRWSVTHLQQHCRSAGLKSVGDVKWLTFLKIRLFLRIFFFSFLGKVLLPRFEQCFPSK